MVRLALTSRSPVGDWHQRAAVLVLQQRPDEAIRMTAPNAPLGYIGPMSDRPRYRPGWRVTVVELAMLAVLVTAGLLAFEKVGPYIIEYRKVDTRYLYREGKITKQEATEILGADGPVFRQN
jgi:hypothetical protein